MIPFRLQVEEARMRGSDARSGSLFSYVDLEERVPKKHPLRIIKTIADEHFSVDGTLVEAWASLKSFRAKDGSDEPPGPGRNGERDFHGDTRTNDTHASTTDPDAKLYRKSSNTGHKPLIAALATAAPSAPEVVVRRRHRPCLDAARIAG